MNTIYIKKIKFQSQFQKEKFFKSRSRIIYIYKCISFSIISNLNNFEFQNLNKSNHYFMI